MDTSSNISPNTLSDAKNPPLSPSASDLGVKSWLIPLVVLALVQFGAPFVPIFNREAALLGAIVVTLAYVGGVVAFSLAVARKQLSIRNLLIGFVLSALAYGVLQLALRSPDVARFQFAYVLQSFALLVLGTFFGLVVSRMIKHANMLGPIGVLVALIDIWGVLFGGIVSQLLTNKATKHIAEAGMGGGPRLGAPTSQFHLFLPDIGIGDFLFLAFFLGVIVQFGMNWRTSALLMWGLISFALLLIVLPINVPALPGLLFIGAGAVLPNLKYFQFTREERFALLYAGIFVVILTVLLYLGLTSMLPKHP